MKQLWVAEEGETKVEQRELALGAGMNHAHQGHDRPPLGKRKRINSSPSRCLLPQNWHCSPPSSKVKA